MIPDRNMINEKIISATCKRGDFILIKNLHRDSPLKSGIRVALHCYLGTDPSSNPKIKLD